MRHIRGALAALALTLAAGAATAAELGEILLYVPRAEWGAAPARPELMTRQTPREIVVHHTGSPQRPELTIERKMRALQAFSQRDETVNDKRKPAWGDLPYHFYIAVSGEVAEGRGLDYAGDTNTGYDVADKIQIVLEGNFETDTPTEAQLEALRKLTAAMLERFDLSRERVHGHDHFAPTACPGRNLAPYVEALRTAPSPG